MRKCIDIVVVIGCLLVAVCLLSGISVLMSIDRYSDINACDLEQGRLEKLVFTKSYWSRFPSLPSISSLSNLMMDTKAILLTCPVILGIWYFIRVKRKYTLLSTGLISLAVCLIPLSIGRYSLQFNTDASECGPWIAIMLVGTLYSVLACGTFASLDITTCKKQN